jgi:hypothetical protein
LRYAKFTIRELNTSFMKNRFISGSFRFIISVTLTLAFAGCNLIPDSLADAVSGATKAMKQDGNSLFHQTELVSLVPGELEVAGEVKKPGIINLENHYKREVFIKESLYDKEHGIDFIGAYRYKGYSLFDLLHPFNYEKKNVEIFRPAIDLYIVIENDKGESVVFSWSEIFHTINPHQVIIATEAAPIVPYRQEVNYKMSEKWKVVAANDLFAYRTLENPVKITVYSFDKKEYPIDRDYHPMFSPKISVVINNIQTQEISPIHEHETYTRYYSSFYGMGMGYHAATYFQGPKLIDLLDATIDIFDPLWNRNGLVCFASVDGYRAIYSYSELFNRTDQVLPILAVPEDPNDGGFYRVFHPGEFYADRSVKSVKEMFFFTEGK